LLIPLSLLLRFVPEYFYYKKKLFISKVHLSSSSTSSASGGAGWFSSCWITCWGLKVELFWIEYDADWIIGNFKVDRLPVEMRWDIKLGLLCHHFSSGMHLEESNDGRDMFFRAMGREFRFEVGMGFYWI
jgi:hypothetical protein